MSDSKTSLQAVQEITPLMRHIAERNGIAIDESLDLVLAMKAEEMKGIADMILAATVGRQNRTERDFWIASALMLFREYPADVIRKAATALISTSRYQPSIAMIRTALIREYAEACERRLPMLLRRLTAQVIETRRWQAEKKAARITAQSREQSRRMPP